MTRSGRRRLTAAGLLAAGLGYGWFAARFGGLPCPFFRLTGLQCPGCGITRMLLAAARGDLSAALQANAFLAVSWPVPAALVLVSAVRRRTARPVPRAVDRLALAYLGALLVWGVVRNL